LPSRYIFVDGEADKFRTHHWINHNYAGGLKNLSAYYKLPNGVSVELEAQAIPANNEYEGLLLIKKKNLGYVKFDYQEFRKYYDKTGGVYHPYVGYRSEGSPLRATDTPKELALDIGHFGVEAGLRMEDYPELTFGYEREFKNGSKSRLTWGTVTDYGTSNPGRKIAPAFSDLKEVADKFKFKAEHTMNGYEVKSEQHWEQVRIDQTRQENFYATESDPTNTDKYILRLHQKPESKSYTNFFQVAKWFLKDKIFSSTGYRFATIKHQEWEDEREYDENLNPIRNGSFSENSFNQRAETQYDSNIWVQNLMFFPTDWFNFGAKLKGEVASRRGESTKNTELDNPPDNTPNRFEVTDSKSTITRWGETFTARFTAIPRTAVYSDLELAQERIPLVENRDSIGGDGGVSTGEIFNRETITSIQKGVWTIGFHSSPIGRLRLTSHYRYTNKLSDYDNSNKSPTTSILSAFFDSQRIRVNEYLGRVALPLTKYFEPSVRYVYRDTDFATAVQSQASVDTGHSTQSLIFDVTSQPLPDLLLMASYNRTQARTFTPLAEFSTLAQVPEFNADVSTWLFTANYAPAKKVSLTNTIAYTKARNFNDFSAIGLPLGAEFDKVDLEFEVKWNLTDAIVLEPKYALYYYLANSNVEQGDYTAQLVSLEAKFSWG